MFITVSTRVRKLPVLIHVYFTHIDTHFVLSPIYAQILHVEFLSQNSRAFLKNYHHVSNCHYQFHHVSSCFTASSIMSITVTASSIMSVAVLLPVPSCQ